MKYNVCLKLQCSKTIETCEALLYADTKTCLLISSIHCLLPVACAFVNEQKRNLQHVFGYRDRFNYRAPIGSVCTGFSLSVDNRRW